MPARKISAKPPIAKNSAKSGNAKYADEHPELQTGYWKLQVVTYDSAASTTGNTSRNVPTRPNTVLGMFLLAFSVNCT